MKLSTSNKLKEAFQRVAVAAGGVLGEPPVSVATTAGYVYNRLTSRLKKTA